MTIAETPPVLPADAALFLDFDGTLIEIAAAPDQVTVPLGLPGLLRGLADRLDEAVALVSGRPIADLDRWLAPLRLPIAGLHGLECRRPDGTLDRLAPPAWIARLRPEMAAFARAHPGVLLEEKPLSLALHYRAVPAEAVAVRAFVDACATQLGEAAIAQRGKMVVELRPAGHDKGSAIDAFMTAAPFEGRRPVFVGDDLTDEHGFAVVNRRGGLSIRVGAPTETAARWALPDVAAVLAWLEQS
jgi:trehalose 6-phosphate phosphatase